MGDQQPTDAHLIKAMTKVIKRRHPNLTVEETVDFAVELIEAIKRA